MRCPVHCRRSSCLTPVNNVRLAGRGDIAHNEQGTLASRKVLPLTAMRASDRPQAHYPISAQFVLREPGSFRAKLLQPERKCDQRAAMQYRKRTNDPHQG